MTSGMQKFQNAGQHGYFYNYEANNQSSTFFVLLLAIILLIALLFSEKRYRELMERFALHLREPRDQ